MSTSVISVPRRLQREQAASPNFLSEIIVELSSVFLRLYFCHELIARLFKVVVSSRCRMC